MATSKEIKVNPIPNGTVIDHIVPAKSIWKIIDILGISKDKSLEDVISSGSIAWNVGSKKYGRKSLLMIENRELEKKEVDKISLVASNATINIIRDSAVFEKYNVELPKEAINIIRCPNTSHKIIEYDEKGKEKRVNYTGCISHSEREPVSYKMILDKNGETYKCHWCGKMVALKDVSNYIL